MLVERDITEVQEHHGRVGEDHVGVIKGVAKDRVVAIPKIVGERLDDSRGSFFRLQRSTLKPSLAVTHLSQALQAYFSACSIVQSSLV